MDFKFSNILLSQSLKIINHFKELEYSKDPNIFFNDCIVDVKNLDF
jgi:hypothetical protein